MKKVLVTASWCGPCFMLKNNIKKQGLEIETIEFDTLDDEDYQKKVVDEWGVRAVPRLVIFDDDGTVVEKIQGSDDIIAKIKEDVKVRKKTKKGK